MLFEIQLEDGRTCRRHQDHVRKWLMENSTAPLNVDDATESEATYATVNASIHDCVEPEPEAGSEPTNETDSPDPMVRSEPENESGSGWN